METSLAPVVAIAVIVTSDVAAADEVVAVLRRAPSRPTVVLGGLRAHESSEAEGIILLRGSMGEAVEVIQGLLARALSRKRARREAVRHT